MASHSDSTTTPVQKDIGKVDDFLVSRTKFLNQFEKAVPISGAAFLYVVPRLELLLLGEVGKRRLPKLIIDDNLSEPDEVGAFAES